ncbi:MAG: nuclear transport factor 2 family protein [Acidimicrobiales bacterium]
MPDAGDRSAEAKAAYQRYVAGREAVARGERSWASLGEEFFTDDAVFVDPAWGRVEGRDAIAAFMDESMAGLDDWTFPEVWTMAEGDRVVSMWWNRLPGERPDGSPYQAAGISVLHYAGDGRFSYEADLLNMAEVHELLGASGWRPSGPMHVPPSMPDRDLTPPRGWLP